jgi:hypothetical protein
MKVERMTSPGMRVRRRSRSAEVTRELWPRRMIFSI